MRVGAVVELHTGETAVPCWLLAGPLGFLPHLGPRASFRGSIWATETSDGWEGEISGALVDVDLQSLVTEQFPHRLSGRADIAIQKCSFRHGRLEEAGGVLTAGPGVIGRSLLIAAADNLHLTAGEAAAKVATLQEYRELALGFVIDTAGITLRGQCSGAPGVLVKSRDGALLTESAGPPEPAVALLRMLVPQSEVQVPATREADWLIGRLPVPAVMPPANQPPQGRLRMYDGE